MTHPYLPIAFGARRGQEIPETGVTDDCEPPSVWLLEIKPEFPERTASTALNKPSLTPHMLFLYVVLIYYVFKENISFIT